MLKVFGILCNAAGVASLYFGGIPYTTKDTILELGPVKAEAQVKRKLEIPPEVSAGVVGLGTVLLLLPRGKK